MVSLEWPTATLLVEETKSRSKQFLSQRNVSHLDVGKWKKGNSVAERLFKQQMDPYSNENEKVAMRSVLGTLWYLARERRPDLSGPVSILQRRIGRAQVSDIQETNRVVRLAKAHTDLALPVCRIPVDQICVVSYRDASGGGIHAEQAQTGYEIMFADMSLLAGLASPVTPVSWRSHSVKQFVASASAADVMGLFEAFAQSGYVRCGVKWCWGWVRTNGEDEKKCQLSYRSRTQRAITITCAMKQSAPVRTGGVPLIWQLFGKTYPNHRCSCGGLMVRRKWQTP